MKTSNISFGAGLDKSTVAFLNEAKKRGLNVKRAEELMKEVCPNDVIKTSIAKNISDGKIIGIFSMGTGNQIKKIFDKDMIIEPKIIRNKKTFAYVWKVYRFSQKFIDSITQALEKLKS